MRAAFYTLGCKVNQNETAALQRMFAAAGYEIVAATQMADVYVVNSCTVTAAGDAKSRQWLRRAKRENPAAITVLTGCYPQAAPSAAALPPADIITGTVARGRLLQNIETFAATRHQVVDIAPHTPGEKFEELPIENLPGHTRAFVKIEDGCNRRCAYCIIPVARGNVRSRGQQNIVAELEALAAQGYKEVVFTGINLPSYGQDTNTNLAELVEEAAKVQGIRRIRLSSLDPDLVTDTQIAVFAAEEKFCPSFHLSLQSGCDETLRRMRRPYTTQQYLEAAQKLRSAMPHASVTTDVIVGFPGETEDEFAQSMAFVQQMEFLKVHVFPYSRRPGTPAAGFEGQVPKEEKKRRARLMQQTADAIRGAWIENFYGTQQEVLLETPNANGFFTGYTPNYIPVLVQVPGGKQGDIVTVKMGRFDGTHALCQL